MVAVLTVGGLAFLFPGQGSQRVGMGQKLDAAYPAIVRPYFEEADETLGFALSHLCFEGPDDDLVKTENQQPAIFVCSVATWAVLRAEGIESDAVAGHSLGEYSALVAAGALTFVDGLRLTHRRGEMMAAVAARTGGIMAAVLGLPAELVEAVCRNASDHGVVEVANYNSATQTVISGEEPAVRRAVGLLKEAGAQRVIQLAVSAPFHSSLMAPLAASFAPVLDAVAVADAQVPIVANVDAQYERTAPEIRRRLVEQLASPVRWSASMERLIGDGYYRFVEVGPGKVLFGLLRGLPVTALNTNDPSALAKTVEQLRPT